MTLRGPLRSLPVSPTRAPNRDACATPAGHAERVTTVTDEYRADDSVFFGGANAHEQVVHVQDQATGLKAIVAIYSTALGPALDPALGPALDGRSTRRTAGNL